MNQIVNNNETATFECFVNGSNSIYIVWQKDGSQNITKNKDVEVVSNGSSISLIIRRATVKDSGTYHCRATNDDDYSVGKFQKAF